MHYTTALEDWVTNMYLRNKILTPDELDIKRISRIFHIFIHHKPLPARYDIFGRYRGITIDSRVTIEEQREQFFHELCHLLRHCGHQSMMPAAFRELQERDARHFTMYALLPYHMLKNYDFEHYSIMELIAHDFKIRNELVIERLDRIKQRQVTLLEAKNKMKYA